MQIKEFAQQIGVSVRTLHYYDEIGLLKPSEVDAQNGYRFYDERSLERMQEILFYRELDFSLKTIAQILLSPDYDKQQALTWQRKLLFAKKERLERLIDALDSLELGSSPLRILQKTQSILFASFDRFYLIIMRVTTYCNSCVHEKNELKYFWKHLTLTQRYRL